MTFQTHIKNLFKSLSVNSVLSAVIMIAHCIQEYKSEMYILEKFEDLKVINKCCAVCLSEREIILIQYNYKSHEHMLRIHDTVSSESDKILFLRFCCIASINKLIITRLK